MSKTPVLRPTPELVQAACERFDTETSLVEASLQELIDRFPLNTDPRHILLKAVAINFLYSTQICYTTTIPNIEDVAKHIYDDGPRIDADLNSGSPELVDRIADIDLLEKQHRNFFSFASKYCSWHRPQSYPIYDSRVDSYIWSLQRQEPFSTGFHANADIWKYGKFRRVMSEFRNYFDLESFTYKQIDKFIWVNGEISPLTVQLDP